MSVSSAVSGTAARSALERGFAARMGRMSVSATAAMSMEAERLRAAGHRLFDFGVGEPDFATPDHIKQAAVEALRQGFTKYTPTPGIQELRSVIAASHARDFGSRYTAAETMVTVGGKAALFNAICALVDDGDEVILPAPYWVSFYDQIRFAGGKPVIVHADEASGFSLRLDQVEAAITPRTRVILLNSPSNPSGAVFPPELFRGVLELCRRHGIWLLSDECYCKFVYDGPLYSVASEPESKDWVVIAGSLSKTYAMTGWRLGFALAPTALSKQMINLQSHSTTGATTFVQKAGIAALDGPQEPVGEMLAEYRRRRDIIVAGLRRAPNVKCLMPAGAFYAYPNIAGLLGGKECPSSLEFSAQLLRDAGVVTVPGEAFGTPGYIRFSYATSVEIIEEGVRRFERFCADRS